ncbi:MAG: hypothetical protein HY796_08310 [Elusimicrobia bacterium]|nr:hypothetical protein [Elusimicrobiota bacterium]
MEHQFDESSLNEQAINDVGTARLALRWALDKIRALQEDSLRARQNLQEKSAQLSFIENQLKTKNSELEKILRSHEEEMKAKQDSLEYQFKARLERLGEREKETEDKIAKQEELFKQKETRLLDDYQKKSDELRGRWTHIESELWQLRQEQLLKQQEFEKLYAARLEEERKKSAAEVENTRASLEKSYATRIEELEKRERSAGEELKKQEAVLKWAKDSFQADTSEREKALKRKDLEIDKKLMEKNQEIDDYKVKTGLLEKQLKELPEAVRKRDEDLERYKRAMESLESVIRTLEDEKKHFQQDSEAKLVRLNELIDAEKNRYREMEAEIPKRLKITIEHERNRFAEKLSEVETNYKEDLRKRAEEMDYLERNLRTFEETIKTLQAERESFANKVEQLQTQHSIKTEEFSFREKQLQTEYDVRLKVELEKHTGALKNEVDSAQRIYEDNLRLKVKEIAHLRMELETSATEKINLSGQVNELRRNACALKEKHAAELDAFKVQSKNIYDTQLSAELEEAARRYGAEKQKISASCQEQLNNLNLVISKKDEETARLRLELSKLEEDKRFSMEEERQKGRNELEAQAASFRDSARLYEDNILHLNKAIEGLKLEREEIILLERERLERLYCEKEKDFDERLARKEQESARLREELIKINNSKDNLSKELDALTLAKESQDGAYRRSIEDFRAKLGEAVGKLEGVKNTVEERQARVAELQVELAENKNRFKNEIAALSDKLLYREKQYGDMRAEYENQKINFDNSARDASKKLNDALMKLKNTEEQKAAREKLFDEAKREIELWKTELAKKEDAMTRSAGEQENLRAQAARLLEENRNHAAVYRKKIELLEGDLRGKDEMLGQLTDAVKGRNAEILRLEGGKSKLETELGEKASQFKALLEGERKEFRFSHEKLTRDFADREKALIGEINSLKEALNARELAVENMKQELKVASDSYQSARAALDGKEDALAHSAGEQENLRAQAARLLEENKNHAVVYRKKTDLLESDLRGKDEMLGQLTDAVKGRNAEILRLEGGKSKLETELGEKASQFKAQLEGERKEARFAREKLTGDFADREKALTGEVNSLKEAMNTRELDVDNMKQELKVVSGNYQTARTALDDSLSELGKFRKMQEEKAAVEKLLDKAGREIELWKAAVAKKEDALARSAGEQENLRAQAARLIEENKNNAAVYRKKTELLEGDLRGKDEMLCRLTDAVKGRNAEILRLESGKNELETELGEKVPQFKALLENERKEFRRLHEELTRDFADREKALTGEVNSLKEALNARDIAAENMKQELKIVSGNYQAARTALDGSLNELDKFRKMQEEKAAVEKLLDEAKKGIELREIELAKKEDEITKQRGEDKSLRAHVSGLTEENKNNAAAYRKKTDLLEGDLRGKDEMLCRLTDAVKGRDAEILRLESGKNKLETELGEKVPQFKALLEGERKEFRRLHEELTRDFADREKALTGEVNSLKEVLNARDIAAENMKQELKIVGGNYQAARTALDGSLNELDKFRKMQEEYEKLKKSLEQLKARINIWKKD